MKKRKKATRTLTRRTMLKHGAALSGAAVASGTPSFARRVSQGLGR